MEQINHNNGYELELYINRHNKLYNQIKSMTSNQEIINKKMHRFKENFESLCIEARIHKINIDPYKQKFNEIFQDNIDERDHIQIISHGIPFNEGFRHMIESQKITRETIIEMNEQDEKLLSIIYDTHNIKHGFKHVCQQMGCN